ncbi:MAG TPA: response regulator [Anaerolineae bacterium]|nr:response regulator [Anaerolineae bacterium]HMR63356.1 response regulator [Anaerolineae bacterium]
MANELVLIIDDSPQMIKFITDYVLKPHHYRYLVAQDGITGLELALGRQPDLILLDMNMPKMTGLEVLEALNTRAISTPIIVMTFHGSEPLAVKTFRMGVKDYLLKPFTDEELLQAIGRALTERRLRQERDELTKRLLKNNQALEQRLRELNTLFGIGKSITSVLDQNKLLTRLVEAAVYLTNAEEGSLLLLDKDTDELYMAAVQGIDRRLADAFRAAVDQSLSGSVLQSGHPLLLTGKDATKLQTRSLVHSLIFVPLKTRGKVSGVLGVTNRHQRRDFTNHDLRLLSTLADYAAISLENAELFNHIADVSTMAQDLQAPLNSIKAYAQMLNAGGDLDDKQQLLIDRLTDGVDQVAFLIDRLLHLNATGLGLDPSLYHLTKS